MNDSSFSSKAPRLSRRRSLNLFAATAALAGVATPIRGFAKKRDRDTRRRLPPLRRFSSAVASDWYSQLLRLIQFTPGYTPPVASRSLAYVSCALYQAVHQGMRRFQSLHKVLPHFPRMRRPRRDLHWGVVANAALAESAELFFPKTSDELWGEISDLRERYENEFRNAAGSSFDESKRHGEIIAQQVFVYSRSDGADAAYDNNFPDDYIPPSEAGDWEPTDSLGALQPYWGENRSFSLSSNDVYDPGPHDPEFSKKSNSAFYALAVEVKNAVDNSTEEEKRIARYWSDDPEISSTPPGHSFSIATQVIREQGINLERTVEVYVKLGIALADAFISCWASKYRYNVIRPVTYIRKYLPNSNGWTPILPTPPFPEYTSGHSVQSGAMAEVLGELLGRNYAFVDRTNVPRGLGSRSYASFEAAAQEAAISRLYGGVHYMPAIDLGVDQGRKIGQGVNALPFRRRRRR